MEHASQESMELALASVSSGAALLARMVPRQHSVWKLNQRTTLGGEGLSVLIGFCVWHRYPHHLVWLLVRIECICMPPSHQRSTGARDFHLIFCQGMWCEIAKWSKAGCLHQLGMENHVDQVIRIGWSSLTHLSPAGWAYISGTPHHLPQAQIDRAPQTCTQSPSVLVDKTCNN